MRIVVLYHANSDHYGKVVDYAAEFKRFKNKDLELMSLEGREGAHMAELYDVTQYPAALAISENGSLQRLWQGQTLPLMDELSYYTQDSSGFGALASRDIATAALLSV
jgi:hypothetical protein